MPRKKRENTTDFPYHVNARCINKEWFRIPIDDVWQIFTDYLYLTNLCFNIRIHSFVLMSNHFHLLVSTPEGNISASMNYFMREVSKEITRRSNRINQTFGGPFHSSVIKTDRYYGHAYKYVYRNPVDAGIVSRVEDYPYSTLAGKVGLQKLYIPIVEDPLLFDDFEGTLDWLNTEFKNNDLQDIKKALAKTEFKLAKNPNTKKKHILENEDA